MSEDCMFYFLSVLFGDTQYYLIDNQVNLIVICALNWIDMEIWTPWCSQVHPKNISIKNNNVTLTRLIWAFLSFWCYLVYKILTCITIWQLEIHYVLSYDIPSVIVYTISLCLYTDNHWLCKKITVHHICSSI